MPPRSKNQARRRKSNPAKSKTYMTFNVIVLIVVFALIFGSIGAIVISGWVERNSKDDTIDVSSTDVDEIEQGYRDQVADHPDDPDALVALASYLGNVGKVEESIQWYEKALTISPNDTSIRLSFASSLAGAAKQADAELQYQKVLALEPTNGVALLGLARLYRSWSPPRNEDAVKYYQLTIQQAPDSVAAELAKSELAQLTGTPVASPAASPSGSPAP
jgi:tetratricopeptide (TPR) repeat protein